MNKLRICMAASLIGIGITFLSTSLIYAAAKSTAQLAFDACDRQLNKDWTFCMGSKDSATRRKCDQAAEAKWKRCYEKNGWIFSQRQPKQPIKPPFKPPLEKAPATTAPAKPTPTPRKEAPARSVNQTATPTPEKK